MPVSHVGPPGGQAAGRAEKLRRLPVIGKAAWWVHALIKAPARIRDLNNFRLQAEVERRAVDDRLTRLAGELATQYQRALSEMARIATLAAPLPARLEEIERQVREGAGRLEDGLTELGERLKRLLADNQEKEGQIQAIVADSRDLQAAVAKLKELFAEQRAELAAQETAWREQRLERDRQRQALAEQRAEVQAQRAELAAQETAWRAQRLELDEQRRALGEQQAELQAQRTGLREQETALAKQSAALQAQQETVEKHGIDLQRQEAILRDQRAAWQESERRWQQAADELAERQQEAVAALRSGLQQVQGRLAVPAGDPAALDEFYVRLEDRFRGPFDDIKERQKRYLPVVELARAGTRKRPVVDLGCGRGEWLQILQERGLLARGIDRNATVLAGCRRLGLEVEQADLFEYLQSLPAKSVGAVTAFQVVEHLPCESIIRLLDETIRVLAPGGVAILETPNPANLLVASYSFRLDPSHLTLVPSPLLRFIAETRGLVGVEIQEMHPVEAAGIPGPGDSLHPFLAGPQDYAVIGWKGEPPGKAG